MGIITLLSAIIFYFLGMPRAEESNDLVDKFKILEKKILIFSVLLIMNLATLSIIIDWSSLRSKNDLVAPLFLGGLVIAFSNKSEILSRLVASYIINLLGEKFTGGYLPVIGSLFLFLSILTSSLYIIVPVLFLFGLFTVNFISIVISRAIKVTT